jgi:hypothetical protein
MTYSTLTIGREDNHGKINLIHTLEGAMEPLGESLSVLSSTGIKPDHLWED